MSVTPENRYANMIPDSFALAYIASRMKQMGIQNYTFEPYVAVLNNENLEFNISSSGEYFYLVSKELPFGAEIQSDSNFFGVWDYSNYMLYNGVQEFHGNIKIIIPSLSGQQIFEFIRVIPQY